VYLGVHRLKAIAASVSTAVVDDFRGGRCGMTAMRMRGCHGDWWRTMAADAETAAAAAAGMSRCNWGQPIMSASSLHARRWTHAALHCLKSIFTATNRPRYVAELLPQYTRD